MSIKSKDIFTSLNLDEEQILLVGVLMHLLLNEFLAEVKITNHKHLMQQPVEIAVHRHFTLKETTLLRFYDWFYGGFKSQTHPDNVY